MGDASPRHSVPRRARRATGDLRGPADAAHACRALRTGATGVPEARRSAPHRRAQDQQCAGSGGGRAPARQAADHRRDRRRAARRRDRDRVRALRPRVHRLHGQRRHAPAGAERRADAAARSRGPSGRVRHAHAEGGDERGDPRLDCQRRHDLLPDRVVRRSCPLSRARPRAAARDRPRGARADPRHGRPPSGCRDRVRRRRLERDWHVHGFRAGRRRTSDRRRGCRCCVTRCGTRRGAARCTVIAACRRRRPDPRRALDLRRARLPRCRAGARVPARHRTSAVRDVHGRRGARCVPPSLQDRGHRAGARVVTCAGARARLRRRAGRRLPVGPRRQGPRRGPAR